MPRSRPWCAAIQCSPDDKTRVYDRAARRFAEPGATRVYKMEPICRKNGYLVGTAQSVAYIFAMGDDDVHKVG